MDKYQKFNLSLKDDFSEILNNTKYLWKNLKNNNIFFTGCTGFFGYWILKTFTTANKKFKLNSKGYVLTREKKFKKSKIYKLCNDKSLFFCYGDIRNFKFPKKKFKYIIHGATTSAQETFLKQDPTEKANIIIDGTKNIIQFAKKSSCKKILYLSSGAVYGNQSVKIKKINETSSSAPITSDRNYDLNVLGTTKRAAELYLFLNSQKKYFEASVARCFSFIGPLIPLNVHYAIGNFLRNSINNETIKIKGDGKAIRSYMYVTDLTIWLYHILFKGKDSQIYNVGSEEKVSILELAKMIKKISKNQKKIIIKRSKHSSNKSLYVPSTKKIRDELKVKQKVYLKSAIKKTFDSIVSLKFF